MMPADPVGTMLLNLVVSLPLYMVWLVGVGLSLVYWRRYPKVSPLTLIAFSLLFVSTVAGRVVLPLLLDELRRRGLGPQGYGLFTAAVVFPAHIGAAILLVVAMFGWRRERRASAGS